MKKVKITWSAFAGMMDGEEEIPVTSVEFTLDTDKSDESICDEVFASTNLYRGKVWEIISPILPEVRSHTALSVGDVVEVDGVSCRCEPAGWSKSVSL